ncbi:MAG: hypothetical protein ACX939_08620 [Hyphococcus sp.]
MTDYWRFLPLAVLSLLAVGCVSYPYETAFSGCDEAAGACYRYCEEFDGTPDYGACHAECDDEANICFAEAYDPYIGRGVATAGVGYPGPAFGPSPWFGRYGAWYPNAGYVFSFNYFGGPYGYGPRRFRNWGYYDRVGPGRRYRGDRGWRYRGDRGRRRGGDGDRRRGGPGRGQPPAAAPPRVAPPRSAPPAAAPPPRQTNRRRPRPGPRANTFPEGDIE